MNGNLPVDQLRGLHLPADPGFWPPAIGWWLLLVIVLIGIAIVYPYLKRYYKNNRWKKVARAELKRIDALPADNPSQQKQQLQAYTKLLRRVSLAIYPRQQVAGYIGDIWLKRLDAMGKTDQFSRGIGRVLLVAPYCQDEQWLTNDYPELVKLIKATVQRANKGK